MKKLKLLCFVLAFVFVIPLGLTACNDKGEPNITKSSQILSHTQEFVDFSLAISGYETQDQDYATLKQKS